MLRRIVILHISASSCLCLTVLLLHLLGCLKLLDELAALAYSMNTYATLCIRSLLISLDKLPDLLFELTSLCALISLSFLLINLL